MILNLLSISIYHPCGARCSPFYTINSPYGFCACVLAFGRGAKPETERRRPTTIPDHSLQHRTIIRDHSPKQGRNNNRLHDNTRFTYHHVPCLCYRRPLSRNKTSVPAATNNSNAKDRRHRGNGGSFRPVASKRPEVRRR